MGPSVNNFMIPEKVSLVGFHIYKVLKQPKEDFGGIPFHKFSPSGL